MSRRPSELGPGPRPGIGVSSGPDIEEDEEKTSIDGGPGAYSAANGGAKPARAPAPRISEPTFDLDSWHEGTMVEPEDLPASGKRQPAAHQASDDEPITNVGEEGQFAHGTGEVGLSTLDEHTVEDQARPLPPLSVAPPLPSGKPRPVKRVLPSIGRLVVMGGNDTGREFELSGKKMTIGRAIDNDVVLTDIAVSRHHIELSFDGKRYVLKDLASGNGTLINDRIEEGLAQLTDGDRLELGNTIFRVDHPASRGEVDQVEGWGQHQGDDDEISTVAGRGQRGRSDIASLEQAQPLPVATPSARASVAPGVDRDRAAAVTAPPAVSRKKGPTAPPPIPGGASMVLPTAPPGATVSADRSPAPSLAQTLLPPGPIAAAPNARTLAAMGAPSLPMPMGQQPAVPRYPSATEHVMPIRMDHAGAYATYAVPKSRGRTVFRRDASLGAAIALVTILIVVVGVFALRGGDDEASPSTVASAGSAKGVTKALPDPEASPPVTENPGVGSNEPVKDVVQPGPGSADDDKTPANADDDKTPANTDDDKGALATADDDKAPAPPKVMLKPLPRSIWGTDETVLASANLSDTAPEVTPLATTTTSPPPRDNPAPRNDPPPKKPPTKITKVSPPPRKPPPPKKPPPEPKKVDVSGIKSKAKGQYGDRNFNGAASTLRAGAEQASGSDAAELTRLATNYEAVGANVASGDADAKRNPTAALASYQRAAALDAKVGGKAHATYLRAKLATVAPKAAASYMARNKYEAAKKAADVAQSTGNGDNPIVQSVRKSLERKAGELYNEANKLKGSKPAEAKGLANTVLRIVPSSSPWYAKAKAIISGK